VEGADTYSIYSTHEVQQLVSERRNSLVRDAERARLRRQLRAAAQELG
jgi:hypothetical protein